MQAIGIIRDYAVARLRNFAGSPGPQAAAGCPSRRRARGIHLRQVRRREMPNNTCGRGRGEEAMLSIVDGYTEPPATITTRTVAAASAPPGEESFDLSRLTAVDFGYVESIFPGFREYLAAPSASTPSAAVLPVPLLSLQQDRRRSPALPRSGRGGEGNRDPRKGLWRQGHLVHRRPFCSTRRSMNMSSTSSTRCWRATSRCAGPAICASTT